MAEEGTKVPIKMKPKSADKNRHVFPSSENVVDALAKEEIAKLFPMRSEFQSPTPTPDLVNLSVVPSIVDLLNHDNTNIAIDVVQLLQDLTDEDVLDDNDDSAKFLVEALVDNSVLELLVQNLHRFSDSDPDKNVAVYNTLATIENLIEEKPAVAEMVCERTKLLKWLLGKIKVREFDSNKQYASEILVILLQSSTVNQKNLGQMNGVDVVLQAAAMYKSKDPKSSDEEQMEKQKVMIDDKAKAQVRTELYCGLGFLTVQALGFMRLTFWELSWDVMEPICFFAASLHFDLAYPFFLTTSTHG